MTIRYATGIALLFTLGCSDGAAGDDGSGGSSSNSGGSAGKSGSGGAASGGSSAGGSGGSSGGAASGGSAGATATGGSASGGTGTGGSGGSNPSGGAGPTLCTDNEPTETAPAAAWANATGNLANMAAACGTLSRVAAKPCSKSMVASVAGHGLWQSEDAGATWAALGTGSGSEAITNNTLTILFDPETPDHMWDTGLFGDGGLYASTDAGVTFKRLGDQLMVQLVGVDFSDPDRKTMVFGEHGMKQTIYRSTDSGASFTNIGATFPAEAHNSESPIVIDSQTYLMGACGTNDAGVCGIHRTTDSGASWTNVSDLEISHYARPLWASNGDMYWPMLFSKGIAKSTDLGLTWTKVVTDTVKDVTLTELPDGSILSFGGDHVQRTTDGGVTWAPIGDAVPFTIDGGNNGGVTYSARQKAIYAWHFDCGSAVASDAIMKAGFDYEQ